MWPMNGRVGGLGWSRLSNIGPEVGKFSYERTPHESSNHPKKQEVAVVGEINTVIFPSCICFFKMKIGYRYQGIYLGP